MKKAFIITAIIMLIAGGAGWYYYDKEQKRQAAERAAHDSIRHARDLENARLAALDKARRDSLDEYEKTHGNAVIREALIKLLDDEVMSGRNKMSGDNWSERIKILREQCENVIAYNKNSDADSVFHAFSFKGLMGNDIRILSDSVTKVYYVSQDSAWADVHFKIQDYPEGQNVTYKMLFFNGKGKCGQQAEGEYGEAKGKCGQTEGCSQQAEGEYGEAQGQRGQAKRCSQQTEGEYRKAQGKKQMMGP